MFESWIMDARYAIRRLLSRRTYALLAVLTLALGAGGTAAIFSIARAVLLDPLPIAREEQVGILWFDGSWTEQEFLRLRGHFPGFQRMAAYRPDDLTLEVPDGPLRLVPGNAVSAEMFDVLGTPPALGRAFRVGEDAVGAEPVVVLSHSLWRELGGDRAIVGKRLRLGGTSRTVIGVMPAGFWFPSPKTQAWTPVQLDPANRAGRYTLVGRVTNGQSLAHMEGPLESLRRMLAANFTYPNPQWDKTRNPSVTPAREFLVGDIRASLVATFAAIGLILLIACANVASLMLGQVDSQATDIAVRVALGANRQRLIQQLAAESLLLGAIAGAAGAVFAALAFQVLLGALPLGALADTAKLDWRVFGASILTALVGALLVAIVPGVALWRGSTIRSSLAAARSAGIGSRGGRLESALVVAQMALAVLLAAGAGLLIRSVANLHALNPGVSVDGVAVVDATLPSQLEGGPRRLAVTSVLPSLQALPGVRSVAVAHKLPLRGSGDNWGLAIRGRPDPNATTAFRMVSRDYFTTMGIPLRRGRTFDPADREDSERVVVINEALAARFFPGEDPLGEVLQTFDDAGERIIGIVGNAAEAELTDPPVPARYMLFEQTPPYYSGVSFVLRADAEAHVPAVIDAARATIAREGRQLAVQQVTTMRNIFDLAMGPTGQVVTLLSLLAGLALVLGAVGVYGAISHYVVRRSRDYGIRIALGQQPARVVTDVVGRGASLVFLGSIIGLAATLAASRLLVTMLYGVRPTDPIVMVAAMAILMTVGVLAAFIPARRASLTDPAIVLRDG
jgi:predicted permease